MTHSLKILVLLLVMLVCFFVNLNVGSVNISIAQILKTFFGEDTSNWSYIILNYRLPKAITAILVGASLGISGVLMQTVFRNPLAGPFVLGISSGASLGVALLVMGSMSVGFLSHVVFNKWSVVTASSVGSFLVLLTIILAATKVRDITSILIMGLMFGSIAAACVNVLSYFSAAEQLQQYIFWGMGSLGNLSWSEVSIFTIICLIGGGISMWCVKSLDGLLMGENYARSMGINIAQTRLLILIATSVLAGSATAFAGPIAFIGLAVPHLVRLLFNTSSHRLLLPLVAIVGASIMLVCDIIAQVPNSNITLPINAVTSLFGAPVVIWLLIKKRKLVL